MWPSLSIDLQRVRMQIEKVFSGMLEMQERFLSDNISEHHSGSIILHICK